MSKSKSSGAKRHKSGIKVVDGTPGVLDLKISKPVSTKDVKLAPRHRRSAKYLGVIAAVRELKQGQGIYIDIPKDAVSPRHFLNNVGATFKKNTTHKVEVPEGCYISKRLTDEDPVRVYISIEKKGARGGSGK